MMILPELTDRLAVCSWSLQPNKPSELTEALTTLRIPRVQLALDPLLDTHGCWQAAADELAAAGIQIVSGMFGTVGEDYSSLESIKETGGIVPDATWDQNWQNINGIVEIASRLKLPLVTFHAGFLPHDVSDPGYAKLKDRVCRIADLFASADIQLAFETGQETAETLASFLSDLKHSHVGVNFDPANMILYAKGDPIDALRTLRPWLMQCHIKDAVMTRTPGTWGEEVAVGTGEVDWKSFFQFLADSGYQGNLSIEREAGEQRLADIQTARDFVLNLNA